MAPFRLGFRVCDRRYPLLWSQSGQPGGRWNRPGDPPRQYLASSPLVAWAEWLHHQVIHDPEDLEGVAAALWAVLIPPDWDWGRCRWWTSRRRCCWCCSPMPWRREMRGAVSVTGRS